MNPKLTLIEFKNRSNYIHQNKYEYTTYVDYTTKIEIICKEHGLFSKHPQHIYKEMVVNYVISIMTLIH